MGRLDWWNIKAEHTPYEWTVQIAMSEAEPFGDERADMRHAVLVANQMAASAGGKLSDEEFAGLIRALSDYLGDSKAEDEVDLEALEKVKQQNGGDR